MTDKEIYNLFIKKANENALSSMTYNNEDELHEKAHALFSKIADEIEQEVEIDKSNCLDCEEWYDTFYDDVLDYILEHIAA